MLRFVSNSEKLVLAVVAASTRYQRTTKSAFHASIPSPVTAAVPMFFGASVTTRYTSSVVAPDGGGASTASPQEKVAGQMIQYALSHARSQKSADGYAHALLVLEQGMSNLAGGESSDKATGMLSLAMATLHYLSGKIKDAVEKLEILHQLSSSSLDVKVAAWESLAGLNLELGQDVTSSMLADECINFMRASTEDDESGFRASKSRAHAIKGLVDLVNGDLSSAKSSFDSVENCSMERDEYEFGNVALSRGVLIHCTGNFESARNLYEKALTASGTRLESESSYLAAANMDPEEVILGGTCALGQLLSHSGKFGEAEELLTKALVKAEDLFGSNHPKVGVILTCIAMMYKHKAKMEASSSILIQEGLYRRAIELLKAPALNGEAVDAQVERRDIVSLARGGYAELLCIQQNRKGEGERMKKWAEDTWRNHRMSLAQALEFSEPPSKMAVVDTRICRVL